MKLKMIFMTMLILLLPLTGLSEEKTGPAPAPSAHVPNPTYTFEKIVEGKEVVHDFIVKNKGTATLDIIKVKPG